MMTYANVLIDQGISDDAVSIMERAMSLVDDNNADMFNNYGAFCSKLGSHGNHCQLNNHYIIRASAKGC